MKIENRFYDNPDISLRASMDGDNMVLEGYAALSNVESRLISENGKKFVEVLERGAFSDVTNNDVYLTFNHSKDKILARTTNKTLSLNEDDKGLHFRATLNNTSDSKNLYEMVSRGDVTENSFAFTVGEGQKWSRNVEGVPLRRISRISNLHDVSVVTKAAYPQTEVYARGLDEFDVAQKPIEIDLTKEINELELVNIKLKIK
jgi:hypothetical protein